MLSSRLVPLAHPSDNMQSSPRDFSHFSGTSKCAHLDDFALVCPCVSKHAHETALLIDPMCHPSACNGRGHSKEAKVATGGVGSVCDGGGKGGGKVVSPPAFDEGCLRVVVLVKYSDGACIGTFERC